jgi:hypothetical protein
VTLRSGLARVALTRLKPHFARISTGRLAVADFDDWYRDAVAAAALTLIRRVLVEGARLSRGALEHEASVHLGMPGSQAIRELDAVAQQLGVSALT